MWYYINLRFKLIVISYIGDHELPLKIDPIFIVYQV